MARFEACNKGVIDMNIAAAQAIVMRDRSDWNKPHLPWLPSSMYRSFMDRFR